MLPQVMMSGDDNVYPLYHVEDVTHFFFFCLQVADIGFAGWNFDRDSVDNFEAVTRKADKFTRVVGDQAQFVHS